VPIIARLAALYETRGIRVASGLNPSHFDGFPLAPFTWFVKDGASLTNGLGIALQEIYFFECLFSRFRPKSIFAIGNSLGWSTLALGLLNPTARVLAIDAGFDRHAADGIRLTNQIAEAEGLKVRAVVGLSPRDVPDILRDEAMPPVEFAFVDGYHTADQVHADFRAIADHAAPGCVYLFHDVASFALTPGIERIAGETGLAWQILLGTTSGMAIVYDPTQPAPWRDDIAPFAAPEDMVALIRGAAWNHRHRHLARWRRSLAKRLGRARPAARIGEDAGS
jgi:hypothetical protein